MPAFKPQQRHLTIQGRKFHFVAYEGQVANPARKLEERPAMWYLMVEGRRCPAVPYDPTQTDSEVDHLLAWWAKDNAIAPAKRVTKSEARRSKTPSQRSTNWWGPN